MMAFAAAHRVEIRQRSIDRLVRQRHDGILRGRVVGRLAIANRDRLRQPQQIARRQRARHQAARPRALERRLERAAELVVELHLDAGICRSCSGQTELDPAARDTLRDQCPHVGLDRAERLRNPQLQIEIAVIERTDGHRDGGALVLARHAREPGHRFDHAFSP